MQLRACLSGSRRKIETIVAIQHERPVFDPCDARAIIETSLTETAATRLLLKTETSAHGVGDCEVRELQIVDDETRFVRAAFRRRAKALAKERDFESKAIAILVFDIAGEVPPFRFEVAVRVMITRKLILPIRRRCLPGENGGE